ncbi:hypothetical protein IWW42_005837 [Coemansia sp. RSA 1085]|nr:hypothetical protein IWW42_005837 [Coemansia sp. RSA 1085]
MQKVFYWAHSSRKLLAIVLVAVVVVAMWRFLSSSMVVHSASNQPTNKPETAQPALSGNTHDAAYSAELNPKLCSELPVPEAYLDNSPAFINIPHPHKIPTGSSVCVRVAVPAAASNASLSYAPFPGTPWDSVLVDLVGQNTGISVPVALQPSSQVQNYIRDKAHIYEADVVLRDADTYIPAGYIEYRNGLWNGEDHDDVVPIGAEQLVVPADAVVAVEDNHAFGLSNYPKLPLCTEPDADGRWIAKDKLPFSTTLPPDNYNRVWLPYDCQLQPYTYKEFAQCLQQKHSLIHWFGDSNTRRALKKITTLGQWCSEPNRITT